MQMPYYQWKVWTLQEKNVIKRMGDYMGMLWLRTPGLGSHQWCLIYTISQDTAFTGPKS